MNLQVGLRAADLAHPEVACFCYCSAQRKKVGLCRRAREAELLSSPGPQPEPPYLGQLLYFRLQVSIFDVKDQQQPLQGPEPGDHVGQLLGVVVVKKPSGQQVTAECGSAKARICCLTPCLSGPCARAGDEGEAVRSCHVTHLSSPLCRQQSSFDRAGLKDSMLL